MSSVGDAAEALRDALSPLVRATTDLGSRLDPPAAVIGPPSLTWSAISTDPTSAQFVIYLVVPADDRAMPRLWELVPQAAAAIDGVLEAVMLRATPGVFNAGGTDLPCYELEVEYSL